MIEDPISKYRPFEGVQLPDRQWPNRIISKAPIWMSTDLRDGNQSIIDPMSVNVKLRYFKKLVEMGFKEIEVGFPSASDIDFEFVRRLIDENLIPDDVTIEVLTQAREDLIVKTCASLQGAKRAILHMYNPLAPNFREIVYKTDKSGVKQIAIQGTRWCRAETARYPQTDWVFQYSPEVFSGTELEFAKEVCDAVVEEWGASETDKVIINLPATVEMGTPNTYADQIEWMSRNLAQRSSIVLSVHPHNDRGTAVAAAELAVMAGADRVEGCLFGNGERTGNVCLVTLAMNLYSQGVKPGLDFSNIDDIKQLAEECTQLPVHPRHPYAGELVYTAFSGSHQDAIKKGFAAQQANGYWDVPYLPIDPKDVGRDYDAVVRVNSQSGKGGVSFLLHQELGLELPRKLQIEFSRIVQVVSDRIGKEISRKDIGRLFEETYLNLEAPFRYRSSDLSDSQRETSGVQLAVTYYQNDQENECVGHGDGAISAAVHGLSKQFGWDIKIADYHEHALSEGENGEAVCYIEMRVNGAGSLFGVGKDRNIVAAALKALFCGLNRSCEQRKHKAA